jgi:hypothetical protein
MGEMIKTVFLGLLAASALLAADQPGCDRACLEGFVNQYLAALTADPGKRPLAKNARYTENGQELKLGDGIWGVTVTLGNYKLYFADPQAGQVGYFGTIEENGHPVILGLRLKIDHEKIAEMEVLALRKTSGVFSEPQNLVDKPIFHEVLAPSERRPRAELVRVANSYLERRFPVVDEERGIVLALVRFDHSGHNKTITWNDGTVHKMNPPFDQPYSFFIDELFKIVDGKINRIEALVTPVPYGMYTGWPATGRR